MIDVYSRYIVGVRVHAREDGALAAGMMREVFGVHGIPHVVHADRGTAMTSKSVADLLEDRVFCCFRGWGLGRDGGVSRHAVLCG